MSWDVKLAKQFKKRDNEEYVGIIVGTVVGVNPLSVSIYNGAAIFSGDNLYICEKINGYKENVKISINESEEQSAIITHEGLKEKDRVAVVATMDNQNLFVIDKII